MKEIKKMIPRIISAVDLTHLQPCERIGLIGNENLRNRREFLEKLLKAGIAVGLPAILFSSCEPEIKYIVTGEEDCPTYTPSSGNVPCACNTDAMATVSPKVISTLPAKSSKFINDTAGIEIRIDIDKALDITTITGAITMTPQPVGGFDVHFYDLSKNNMGYKTSLALCKTGTSNKIVLLDDTSYTITLKGTIKDINGKYLDGNGDGTGGDDFSFSFNTVKKYDSCICQADCSCVGNTCACQSNVTCSCQNNTCFACTCMYLACPTNF
jgi:hypothetical protein